MPEPAGPTLRFEGTDALIRLPQPIEFAAVLVDQRPLPADRWRLLEDGSLRVACPPSAFDAQPHCLRLESSCMASGSVELAFRSDYRCALDSVDDRRICGWIYDALRPASLLTLDIAGEFSPC